MAESILRRAGRGAVRVGRKAADAVGSYARTIGDVATFLPRTYLASGQEILSGIGDELNPQSNTYRDPREYQAAQLLTRPATSSARVAAVPTAASQVSLAPPPLLRSPSPDLLRAPADYSGITSGVPSAQSILQGAVGGIGTAGQAARPYAYQQQPIRNAFTMGAPADDSNARLKAQEAIKRFNIAEESYKSNKTPEAEAAYREAQADTERWSKWAAMPANTRKQVLMAGERAANAAQGRDNFATLRNEMDTPGAAELLAYAAAVNKGGPAVTRQTDGTAAVQGRYGSGAITGFVPRGTRTAQSLINDNLLLDQAARAKVAPSRAADILKNRRY